MTLPKKRFKAVLDNVATTLAGLSAFQIVTNSDDATEAADHIYRFAAKDDDDRDAPPRIILDVDEYVGRLNGGGFRGPTFVLVLHQYAIPSQYHASYPDQADWFWSEMDDWLDELEDVLNGSAELSVDSLQMTMSPGLIEPDDLPAEFLNRYVWSAQFRLEVQT